MGESWTMRDAEKRYGEFLATAQTAGWRLVLSTAAGDAELVEEDCVRLSEAAETVHLLAAALRAAKSYETSLMEFGDDETGRYYVGDNVQLEAFRATCLPVRAWLTQEEPAAPGQPIE